MAMRRLMICQLKVLALQTKPVKLLRKDKPIAPQCTFQGGGGATCNRLTIMIKIIINKEDEKEAEPKETNDQNESEDKEFLAETVEEDVEDEKLQQMTKWKPTGKGGINNQSLSLHMTNVFLSLFAKRRNISKYTKGL